MQSAVASIRRLVASPSSVVMDKLRSRFWSLAEQRLWNGSVPVAPIAPVWNPPAGSAIGESERARCLESANQIIEGVLPIFGMNVPFEGMAPNWLQDPASKLTWPFVHHSRIDV